MERPVDVLWWSLADADIQRLGMKEAPSLSSSSLTCSNLTDRSNDVEEYRVDTSSTSSKDSQDEDDFEADGTIALSEKPHLSSFGSVSVVNSNDVHFGNKTVYQGPVTIKQFVYPGSATPSESINGLEETIKNAYVDVDLHQTASGGCGIDNPNFVKDSCLSKDGVDKVTLSDNNPQRTMPGIRKGFLWLKNLPNKHRRNIVIFISVLLAVSFTMMMTIIYWRHPEQVIGDFPDGDTDEQDNNTPVDYSSDSNILINKKLRLVSRLQWLAQPPIEQPNPLKTPVSLVIIQHTATEPCVSLAQCMFQVKTIQTFHIASNNWWDIGYNFLLGGDGAAYEGRGWLQEGAHTLGYNNRSIGVGFIGTFSLQKPPLTQIVAFKKLMEKGVDLGYITHDYKILGARQLYGTESPGTAFFKEIQTWPHWSAEL